MSHTLETVAHKWHCWECTAYSDEIYGGLQWERLRIEPWWHITDGLRSKWSVNKGHRIREIGDKRVTFSVNQREKVRESTAELMEGCSRRKNEESLQSGAEQLYFRIKLRLVVYHKGDHVRKIADTVRVQVQMKLGVSHICIERKDTIKQALNPSATWSSTAT